MDAKGSVYETGDRIFHAPVSAVDIAATMFDFTGITPEYNLDIMSQQDVAGDAEKEEYQQNDRCICFENEKDRAVRCGCNKYLTLYQQTNDDYVSSTFDSGTTFNLCTNLTNLCNLCDSTGAYEIDKRTNKEIDNLVWTVTEAVSYVICFLFISFSSLHQTNYIFSMTSKETSLDTILNFYVAKILFSATPDYSLCFVEYNAMGGGGRY